MSNLRKGESGQVLVYTTIIVMLAALIITPLLDFTFSSYRSTRIREERTLELYASDAGIEDALYQIKTEKKGTELANLEFGDSTPYSAGTPPMNDRDVNVTIEKVWLPEGLPTNEAPINDPGNPKDWTTPKPVNDDLNPSNDTDKSDKLVVVGMLSEVTATAASDNFESGTFPSGGAGNWTSAWQVQPPGSASLGSGADAHGGTKYLSFVDSAGSAQRQLLVPRYMSPQLQFYAKARSFEAGDTVDCQVSTDGINWTTVEAWADGNDTDTYALVNINLPPEFAAADVAKPMWIRFNANMTGKLIASDDFSSGNWAGGSGWASPWTPSPSGSSVATAGAPHSAPYHLRLKGTGYASRPVDISGYDTPQLQFWAKASSFAASDRAYCEVFDGSAWHTVQTWSASQGYQLVTIDVSQYKSSVFAVRFDANLTTGTLASDTFQTSSWNGGSGWVAAWNHSSSYSSITSSGTPYSSPNHLRLQRTGWADRAVNISDYDAPHLRFYAKTTLFESGDRAYCYVSTTEGNWQGPVATWTNNQGYTLFDIDLSSWVPGASTVWVRFEGAMVQNGFGDTDNFYVDNVSIVDNAHFYVDDVQISDHDYFCVDDVWIGANMNDNTIEVAYIDNGLGPAYLDRIGVWMPPGCNYSYVIGNETIMGTPVNDPDILTSIYAGGTILEWDFSPPINLAQPVGGGGTELPIVRSLTYTYRESVTQDTQGMFVWIEAHGGGNPAPVYISWDKGYEIYKATSQASSEIFGSNTQVTAYAAQGEVNKRNAVSYGDYKATGNPLLIDAVRSIYLKETAIDPGNPSTWVLNARDGLYYDGRSEITTIPADARVLAGWLYWGAFMNNSDWASFGSRPDGNVSFMYPQRYVDEPFMVAEDGIDNPYLTDAWRSARQEPMDLLAHEPVLTLSPWRYSGEPLGQTYPGDGDNSFLTLYKPVLTSPAAKVWLVGNPLPLQGNQYTINYATGNVTITDDSLSGQVTIDYSVSGSMPLTKGSAPGPGIDYMINQLPEGNGYKYTGFTVTNDKLVGNVTIDYYYAKRWETVQHAAYDRYGTALNPVAANARGVGWTYACFVDVSDLLTNNGAYEPIGNGQYAVRNVTATQPPDSGGQGTLAQQICWSGWSIIVLYESPNETAHQFYLYDPIHNAADCPFTMFSGDTKTFTLNNFYPPEGTVEGRTTYFVGEGDQQYWGDSVGFKGASQTSYTLLHDPNPGAPNYDENNVMNTKSTTGESGVDIDTFNILGEVGSDTSANVRLHSDIDYWYLVYTILSFKTNQVPKADYAFTVNSVTYQYELGATR